MLNNRKTIFKVKPETPTRYNELLVEFGEMLESWKYNKDGRNYELVEDEDNLTIKVKAWKE